MNFFTSTSLPKAGFEEFETLHDANAVTIERIASNNLLNGQWYDQDHDEWVILTRGNAIIELDDGSRLSMTAGDYLLLKAHIRHRVTETSKDALWLAVHIKDTSNALDQKPAG